MIRVIFRLTVADSSRDGFVRAWRETATAIGARARGSLGARLLQSTKTPDELVIVSRWESLEAWRAFWSVGPPEPQGDPACTEVLIEIDEVGAKPADPGKPLATREVAKRRRARP